MAVTVDSTSNGGANASSHTFSHTVGSGSNRALYVATVTDASASRTVTGVTYNGTSLDLVDSFGGVGVSQTQCLTTVYRMVNPPTGTANVVVSISAASAACSLAISLSDVDQTTPNDGWVESESYEVYPSLTVTSATDDLVMMFLGTTDSNTPVAPGTGETEIGDRTQNYLGLAGYYQAGAASVVMAPAPQADFYSWAGVAFNVNASGGGGSVTAPRAASYYAMLRN